MLFIISLFFSTDLVSLCLLVYPWNIPRFSYMSKGLWLQISFSIFLSILKACGHPPPLPQNKKVHYMQAMITYLQLLPYLFEGNDITYSNDDAFMHSYIFFSFHFKSFVIMCPRFFLPIPVFFHVFLYLNMVFVPPFGLLWPLSFP